MANQMDKWIAGEGDPVRIANRITAIFVNRGYGDVVPTGAKLDRMVANVQDQGAGYFDTIRKAPDRYVTQGSQPVEDNTEETMDPEPEPVDLAEQVQINLPWLPPELADIYADAYAEWGDAETALNVVRQDERYERLFPGIKRDDGSLVMTEGEYLAEIEGYGVALESFGVPASTFSQHFPTMIQNGRSAREFRQDVAKTYAQVSTMSTGMRQYYAEQFGAGDISVSALLASALDPTMDPLTAEHEFRVAKIGGAAKDAGFDVALADAERMADFGMTRQAATDFFTRAKSLVPTLGQLAARHNDPDDDFDIEEATEALIFQDPEQARRVQNLMAREEAAFTEGGAMAANEQGAVRGLVAR